MPRRTVDIAGRVFGELTAIAREGTQGGQATWRCLCICGEGPLVRGDNLRGGQTKSCGHARRREPKPWNPKPSIEEHW